jgi:glycosyltransferase involved in cell wall biosynthesis
MRPLFIEVAALFEPSWSGIAHVTANLCRSLLRTGLDVRFFAYDKLLRKPFVENALRHCDGTGLKLLFEYGLAVERPLRTRERSDTDIGIFPNFKRASQDFSTEVLIVHDLSFILTPELHELHLVTDYMQKIYRDAHSMDRCICVSRATGDDLVRYFGVPEEKVSIAYLGVNQPVLGLKVHGAQLDALNELHLTAGTFFLVLGTIEPRRNVALVLDYIKSHPDFLDSHGLVFAGRNGWGKPFAQLLQDREISDSRIIHLGYVSELLRLALLRHCKALIFPSIFEGFGLPIIEAMACGTPVIGSCSSSIVEVGGACLLAFDPCSATSFADTMQKFLKIGGSELQTLKAECRTWASQFTWDKFRDRILEVIDLETNSHASKSIEITFGSLKTQRKSSKFRDMDVMNLGNNGHASESIEITFEPLETQGKV